MVAFPTAFAKICRLFFTAEICLEAKTPAANEVGNLRNPPFDPVA